MLLNCAELLPAPPPPHTRSFHPEARPGQWNEDEDHLAQVGDASRHSAVLHACVLRSSGMDAGLM